MSVSAPDLPPSYSEDVPTPASCAVSPARSEQRDLSGQTPMDLPPRYAPLDPSLHCVELHAPYVLATTRSSSDLLPRYQFDAQVSRSGKSTRLHVRRLLASETRSLASKRAAGDRPFSCLAFDHDMTLYVATRIRSLSLFASDSLEIHGRQAGTVKGTLRMATRKRAWWIERKLPQKDSLAEVNRMKIEKYGYRPDDEVERTLLFRVTKVKDIFEWRLGNEGTLVAREAMDGLEMVESMEVKVRDVLVMCWLSGLWFTARGSWQS